MTAVTCGRPSGWHDARYRNGAAEIIARVRTAAARKLEIALARFGTCAVLLAIAAPALAGPDAETDQMLCDLAGQCGPDARAATNSAAAPTETRGAPRTGATRGFTFKRTAPTTAITPPDAPTRPMQPAHTGEANLRLGFASGSAMLNGADKARLAKLAQVLGSPVLASRRARIEGHTDSSGSARSNLDLSRRRAQSAADYLVAAGIDAQRLEVVGFGSTRPIAGISAQAPENRRVMAVILD